MGKNCPKSFSGKFGEIRTRILRTPRNLRAPTPVMKSHLRLHCPPFARSEGEMPPPCLHSPASLCIVFYTLFTTCCRLQCVTVMKTNQWSPKTEQFIPAKISGNALKQWSTHSVLRQGSSQLQQCKAARMSRGIPVDQNVCSWDDGHPGLNV